jgi:hypothetical protein
MLQCANGGRGSEEGKNRMRVAPVGPFVIENEPEADAYLRDLLEKPENRSMNEVRLRANKCIQDDHLKSYFIKKAQTLLKA